MVLNMPFGWKTYAVAVIQVVVGVLSTTNWVSFLDNPQAGLVAIGSGLMFAAMRYVTQQTTVKEALALDPGTKLSDTKVTLDLGKILSILSMISKIETKK